MIWKIEKWELHNQKSRQKDNIQGLWDNIKCANLCIIGVPEGEEREKGIENALEEIMAENFPNPKKEMNFQV